MFSLRDAIITGGDFRQQITHVHHADSAIHGLHSHVAHAAFHNSAQRVDAPRCHPNTRVAVKKDAHRWVMRSDNTTAGSFAMWLSGGAGAGKSAIAQSLAEEWFNEGILLASFFFNRSDSSRNHVGALVATLVAQVYNLIPQAAHDLILRAIEDDPLIWSRDIITQFHSLVAKPLHNLIQSGFFHSTTSPRVLVIDGLDECLDWTMRGKVLQLICKAQHEWHLPFLFLVASRPEPDIIFNFESVAGVLSYFRVNLSNNYMARSDIERFLRDKLAECQKSHPFRQYIPSNWPSDAAINTVVQKSSGHFIYASVTVQYVTSSRHHPHRRLEIILALRPAPSSADTPFAELDALYSQILSSVQDFPLVRRILGLHILTNLFSVSQIEAVLRLEDGDVHTALSDLTSLVSIDGNAAYGRLRLLHVSFQDYLFDSSRSGEYYTDTAETYGKVIIALLSCLSLWLPDDNNSIIGSVCFALKKCFRKAEVDSTLSEYMCSSFSLHLIYFNIARHLALTKPRQGRVVLYNRMLATASHVLVILDASTSPFATQISEKLRADFDSVVTVLLDKLPHDNRLKLNIAAISRSVALTYRAGDVLCLDEHFLDMTVPSTDDPSSDFPLFFERDSDEHPDYFKELHLFFTNVSRSRKYAVSPQSLSGAALFCIEYLRRCKAQLPVISHFPKWSPRVSALRKSYPCKWRRKSNFLVYDQKRITPTPPYALRSYFSSPGVPENNVDSVDWKAEQYRMALTHLTRLLPVADQSPELVEACTNAAFSSMSMNLPRTSRRARRAMQKYLDYPVRYSTVIHRHVIHHY